MDIDFYKNELSSIKQKHWPEIEEWLGLAYEDDELDFEDCAELYCIAENKFKTDKNYPDFNTNDWAGLTKN